MHRTPLAFLLLAGCNLFESGGNSGEGRFVASLPPALVKGTKYDLEILDYEPSRSKPTTLSSASSTDVSVASAVLGEGGLVTLEATTAGEFALEFTAEADGDDVMDRFPMRAIDPVRLELDHPCDATYVADRPADVVFWFSDPTRLRGEGYGLYPVDVAGAELDPDASTARTLRILLGDRDALITSTLFPPNEVPSELALEVMPSSALTGAQIVDANGARVINGRRLEKDAELAVRVVPAIGDRALCGSALPSRVSVSDDSDCMLARESGGELQSSLVANGGAILIVAAEWGLCLLTAELTDEGLVEALVLDLAAPQSSSSSSSDFD